MTKEAVERTRTMQRTIQVEKIEKVKRFKEVPAVYDDKHTEYREEMTYSRNNLNTDITDCVKDMKQGIKDAHSKKHFLKSQEARALRQKVRTLLENAAKASGGD